MECSLERSSGPKRPLPYTTPRNKHVGEFNSHRGFQQFPKEGTLWKNLNVDLNCLERIAALEPDGEVYAYIVRTVKWDLQRPDHVIQTGSAPNIEGGRITLCTCKHDMRAGRRKNKWPGVWIAGFCSGAMKRPQGLFYLMRVEQAFETHSHLWKELLPTVREAKSMSQNPLGDVLEPKTGWKGDDFGENFDPANYDMPQVGHAHRKNIDDMGWLNDLVKGDDGRVRWLLLGVELDSYIWSRPSLKFDERLGIGRYGRKFSLDEFVHQLSVIKG